MDKNLSNKINIIRIISMLLIVTCHYLQYYNIKLAFFLNVGVQIFFMISGFLYGFKDIKDFKKFWKSRIFKIIIPYYIVITCFFLYCFITDNKPFSYLQMFYYFTMFQGFNTNLTSLNHLWFISYIVLFYMLIPILQKLDISQDKNYYLKLLCIIIILQLLQFLNVININISYFMCFIVGYYFSRRYIKHNIKDNFKMIFLISFFIILIGIPMQIFLEKYEFSNLLAKLYIIYCDYIHVFLAIFLFILFIKILPSIKNKVFDYISKISYSVYLVHQIFILGTFSLLNIKYGILLSLVIIIVLSAILTLITSFINNIFNYTKKGILK